ncbi:hypothetical protein Cus16_1091 [Curtobacterium sp. ER1/6]|nr:hypothetical protein Cus16_1091 [Curtobacterium sp. ER1/6]
MAGRGDGVVPHRVAVGPGTAVEGALDDALAAGVRQDGVEVGDDVVEPGLRGLDGLPELVHLVRVLHEPELGQVAGEHVVGRGRGVGRLGPAHRGAEAGVERAGQLVVGVADEQHRGVETVGDLGEGAEVGRREFEVGGDLVERRTRADPELADLGVRVELLGVAAGRGTEVQRGVVPGPVRRQHEHGADDRVGAPAGQVREGRVRAEREVAVVRAHLRLSGGHHDRAPGVQLGDPGAALGCGGRLLAGLGSGAHPVRPLRRDVVLEGRGPGSGGTVARRARGGVGHVTHHRTELTVRPERLFTCR